MALMGLCGASCAWLDEERSPPHQSDAPAVPAEHATTQPVDWHAAPDRRGGALVRSPRGEVLYIADEDWEMLRVVPLPLEEASPEDAATAHPLPGPPAQVLALDDRVLVTIREPSLLVALDPADLHERQRVALPLDAWGVAVTEDERTALVTSPWANQVSAVDLASGEVRWSVATKREPRGVVVIDDRAYVTHMVGSDVTRIDHSGGEPTVTSIELPAGSFSAPLPGTLGPDSPALAASLAYAPVLSPDGGRLFVPRHALGGVGWQPWFGRPVVDVLLTGDDTPLAPPRDHAGLSATTHRDDDHMVDDLGETVALPRLWTVQPRAAVYRHATDTLLVVSEGEGRVTELDARALDPSLHPFYRYELIRNGDDSDRCGAPSGIALSADEELAYVWCRTTQEVVQVALVGEEVTSGPDGHPAASAPTFAKLADDPLPEPAALGRRLFFDARGDSEENRGISGGLACAGCHPDGRDDGHTWLETKQGGLMGGPAPVRINFRSPRADDVLIDAVSGHPRQTPMLAGRVEHDGPYGWRGEQPDLAARVQTGFAIHRWRGREHDARMPLFSLQHGDQAAALAAYLRQGLREPGRVRRALTAEEERGRALFDSTEVGCSSCHLADGNGEAPLRTYDLAISVTADERASFRVPPLLHVGKMAPYLHDGRYASLSALIDGIGHDMGSTADLDASDREALVAFLETIGHVDVAAPASAVEPAQPWPFAPRAQPGVEPDAEPRPEPRQASHASSELAGWPRTISPVPTRAEWDAAPPIAIRHLADGCGVFQVREWVRVVCRPGILSLEHQYFGPGEKFEQPVERVALVAGDRDETNLVIEQRTGWNTEGVAVFPLRPGTRRFIEIDRRVMTEIICSRYVEWFMAGTFMISASWLDGDDSPDLVVTRYGRHPRTGTRIVGHSCG